MSRQSRRVASSGASNSYSWSLRSPDAASYLQTLRATCTRSSFCSGRPRSGRPLVLPLLWLPLRHAHRLGAQLRAAVLPGRDRVPHEVLVVAARVVIRARVGAAALLAGDPALEHAGRDVEQVAELERLREVGVEDRTLVLDDDAPVPLPQPGDDLLLAQHLLLAPEDAEVLEHRGAELVADLVGALALAAVEQLLQLALGVRDDGCRDVDHRVRERPLGRRLAGPAAEGDRLHERVAAEAVR